VNCNVAVEPPIPVGLTPLLPVDSRLIKGMTDEKDPASGRKKLKCYQL
jgi:hypothetical protein